MKAGKPTAAADISGGLGLATIETTWNITTWSVTMSLIFRGALELKYLARIYLRMLTKIGNASGVQLPEKNAKAIHVASLGRKLAF